MVANSSIASTNKTAMHLPWVQQQLTGLLAQRGHAWLLQGPSGLNQYNLALELASAWLCDRPTENGACGVCESCHLMEVRVHPDFYLLMPETTMAALAWPLSEKTASDAEDGKRKLSREIRVEAMRAAIEFSQRTNARGRGKVVLVYPAEQMNTITANALLKTLEEPPGSVRFVLATNAAHQLLPTIKSRCIGHSMLWPAHNDMLAWLQTQNIAPEQAQILLRATGARPEDALRLFQAGFSPAQWAGLPKALAQGDGSGVVAWDLNEIVLTLQKICHDLLALKAGAMPRYFLPENLPTAPSFTVLSQWSQMLIQVAKTVDHPFNPNLMREALVSQAQNALNSKL